MNQYPTNRGGLIVRAVPLPVAPVTPLATAGPAAEVAPDTLAVEPADVPVNDGVEAPVSPEIPTVDDPVFPRTSTVVAPVLPITSAVDAEDVPRMSAVEFAVLPTTVILPLAAEFVVLSARDRK